MPHRIAAGIGAALGLLALFLAALGVYGIVAYMVTQRTREIGVRIALGASRRQVLGRVVKGGVVLAVPGFLLGTAGAVGLGHVFRAVIVDLRPLEPIAYVGVTLVLLLVTGVASLVPAVRASSIEPMDALRTD